MAVRRITSALGLPSASTGTGGGGGGGGSGGIAGILGAFGFGDEHIKQPSEYEVRIALHWGLGELAQVPVLAEGRHYRCQSGS